MINWLKRNSITPININENINLIEGNILDSFGFVLLVTEIQSDLNLSIDIDSLQDIEDYTLENLTNLIVSASNV